MAANLIRPIKFINMHGREGIINEIGLIISNNLKKFFLDEF
jgi:hypothetical protein